jgi:PPOX class probable F420-dependent enzyme
MLFDPAKPEHVAAEQRLRTELVVWLTTVRPDGQPQSSPVWFLWDGRDITLLSMPNADKVRNIRGNPLVALNLDGDRRGGDIVTVEGTAEIVAGGSVGPAYLEKYEGAIRSLESSGEEFAAYSQLVRVTPIRVRVY